jgi:hypothetical protein
LSTGGAGTNPRDRPLAARCEPRNVIRISKMAVFSLLELPVLIAIVGRQPRFNRAVVVLDEQVDRLA